MNNTFLKNWMSRKRSLRNENENSCDCSIDEMVLWKMDELDIKIKAIN
jgi:hypothetical protein